MAKRDNHYEAAFEEHLRRRGVPYVAVDEARRSLVPGGGSLKSLDFIVSSPGGATWLVDIKGRHFPSGGKTPQYWKNWSTQDDIDSLRAWEQLFGCVGQALIVFAYQIVGAMSPLPERDLFEHNGQLYGFVGVRLADYAAMARRISPRWQTLAMSTGDFRRAARPLDHFLLYPSLAGMAADGPAGPPGEVYWRPQGE